MNKTPYSTTDIERIYKDMNRNLGDLVRALVAIAGAFTLIHML